MCRCGNHLTWTELKIALVNHARQLVFETELLAQRQLCFFETHYLKKVLVHDRYFLININEYTLKTNDAFYLKTNIRTMHQIRIGAQSLHC